MQEDEHQGLLAPESEVEPSSGNAKAERRGGIGAYRGFVVHLAGAGKGRSSLKACPGKHCTGAQTHPCRGEVSVPAGRSHSACESATRGRRGPPELRRVVDVLTPHPAFVIGRRWDILFRNRAADLVFCFDEPFPPHSLNVVWRSF
jgi:hypothetical protein